MKILVETKSSFICFRDVVNFNIESGIAQVVFEDDRVQVVKNIQNITILEV